MKRISIRVSGKVQGVFYRQSTKDKARQLGLGGYVQNMQDGSVYIEAEGRDEKLEELVAWCRKGPELARVEDVQVENLAPAGESAFEIRRS